MAFSISNPVGDGTTTLFNVPFPYLSQADVSVKVGGVTASFSWQNATTVIVSPAPANGAVLEIRRTTPKAALNVVFQDGSVLGKTDLNNEATQLLYIAQEAFDANATAMNVNSVGMFDATSKNVQNVVDPVLAQDAATKNYVDGIAVAAGNVAPPGAGNIGKWLKATGASAWGWASIVCASITDASAFGISILQAANAAAVRTLLGLASGATTTVGTAATAATGTSGGVLGLLNTLCTWSAGLVVTGAGLVVGTPTGGDKGAGTVNATAYYVNGAAQSVDQPRVIVQNRQVSGTAGTALTSGSWQDLVQTTALLNNVGATVTTPNVILTAGTYDVTGFSTFVLGTGGSLTKLRLFNTTAGAVLADTSGNNITSLSYQGAPGAGGSSIIGPLRGRFTIASTSSIKMQQWCNSASCVQGIPMSSGEAEVFSQLEFVKVA